jgi:hypothetical protein
VIRAVGFVFLLGASTLSCAAGEPTTDAPTTDSVVMVSDLETSPDMSTQPVIKTRDPFDSFGVDTNGVRTTVYETAVWLVNQSAQPLIVTASGGAESVVVDTVGAADSAYVMISTRALTLELSARTSEGLPMGTVTLPMDSTTRRAAFPH